MDFYFDLPPTATPEREAVDALNALLRASYIRQDRVLMEKAEKYILKLRKRLSDIDVSLDLGDGSQ